MKHHHNYLLFAVLFSMHLVANGQCCSGGVPISGTLGLATNDAKAWQFLLTYDYNVMNNLFVGSRSLGDRSRKRETHSVLLETNYGLSKRITLTTMFSFVRQTRHIQTTANSDFTRTQGLGDGIFLIKYRILVPTLQSKYSLSVGLGPKFPLGKSDFNNEIGIALPADLQPGTGAWDALFWANFERYHLFWQNFNLTALFTYRYTGTNNDYFGVQSYQFGKELALNLQSNYRLLLSKQTLDIALMLRYRRQGEDFLDKEPFPNSGGRFLFLIPSLNYGFSPRFSFRLASYLPLHRHTGGTQLATTQKLITGLSFNINPKDN